MTCCKCHLGDRQENLYRLLLFFFSLLLFFYALSVDGIALFKTIVCQIANSFLLFCILFSLILLALSLYIILLCYMKIILEV